MGNEKTALVEMKPRNKWNKYNFAMPPDMEEEWNLALLRRAEADGGFKMRGQKTSYILESIREKLDRDND